MNPAILAALRILSHFWLEEIQPTDLPTITALPELAETLPDTSPAALTGLAVEYQRLFGFNLPPYESVFIDPSAMLQSPAAAQVQALYQQAGWTPPAGLRVGAPDHLGLELLALAEVEAKAEAKETLLELAFQLHTAHLALWVPAFVLALRRLEPHPFYATLADLSLDLLLSTLPLNSPSAIHHSPFPPPSDLTDVVKQLLTPWASGLFLTREDIARLSRQLDLPTVMGERAYMLETLFRQAGEYELVPALLDQLRQLLAETEAAYQKYAEEYPAWLPYAEAWRWRLAAAQVGLNIDEQ